MHGRQVNQSINGMNHAGLPVIPFVRIAKQVLVTDVILILKEIFCKLCFKIVKY